jgi:hypothetical protein
MVDGGSDTHALRGTHIWILDDAKECIFDKYAIFVKWSVCVMCIVYIGHNLTGYNATLIDFYK